MFCDKLSASRCKAFEKCPFYYFLVYHYRLDIREEKDYFSLGTIVHSIFEYILTNRLSVIDYDDKKILGLSEIIDATFLASDHSKNSGYKTLEEATSDPIYVNAKKIVEEYVEYDQCKLFLPVLLTENGPAIELSFTEDIGDGCIIHGFIDAIFVLNESTLLVNDFKTSKNVISYGQLLEDIQLKMYYYVTKKMFPDKDVIVNLDFVKLKKNRSNAYQNKDVIETEIKSKYNKIIDFDPDEVYRASGWQCDRFCIGRDNCYQLWLTMMDAKIV